MALPSPREKLAGCFWLPRIIAKARLFHSGQLPAGYAARFGAPDGVDGLFLSFFALKRETILVVCDHSDDKIAAWFSALPNAASVEEWNRIAVNLGRAGFPMADRMQPALSTTYAHLQGRGLETVFALLEADEA